MGITVVGIGEAVDDAVVIGTSAVAVVAGIWVVGLASIGAVAGSIGLVISIDTIECSDVVVGFVVAGSNSILVVVPAVLCCFQKPNK